MKKLISKATLLFLFVLGSASVANAQLAMTRSIFTSTYNPISVGTGATATTISGDDGVQTLLPIGFTFNYLGTPYTTVDGCANGWISFNSSGANAWTNSGLFTTTIPNLTLAAWWDDLNVGTGSVIYQTQGTPGSQTFTVQWTDVLSYNGSLRTINFQTVLYEGTNVIEFRYSQAAFTGAFSTSESASIGIEGATGGPGNFIDAVSGSSFINQSYMTTHKWPTFFYRFTPGAPSVLSGGTYTVGLTGAYANLTEAFAEINHRGISGPVTLSLIDAVYDTTAAGGRNIFPLMLGPVAGNSVVNTITIQPAAGTSTLTYRGVVSGNGGNQTNATAFGTANEPILAVVGADYVTMRNLNFQTVGNGLVDRGLLVANATATDGSTNGLYENITVTLSRTTTTSIAIQQNTITAATSAAGANSNNTYRNLAISNTYSGIYLLGSAAFPDLNSVIGNSSPTTFNTIGSTTAFDIGGGTLTTQCYGIRAGNQSGVQIYNNIVRNVSAQTTTDGILLELSQGTCSVYNNMVSNVRNNSTSSASFVTGIRANVATTGSHSLRVYNNFVYGVSSAYTGAATATRIVKGIFVQSAGGGLVTHTISVDNNSVLIDGSGSTNASSTCFEIGTTSGPVINVRNNVFSNITATQTAPAAHYAWVSTSATATGNTGSISDRNDLYVQNATQGFVGLGGATTYASLANWQTGVTQDAASVSVDPAFVSATDLHASAPQLDAAASTIAWVTTDIDNQARAVTPDIGADEFVSSTLDAGVSLLVNPVAAACYTSTQQLTVRLRNFAAAALDLSVNNVTIVANITGAITQSFTVTLTNNALNAGLPIPPGATVDVPMGIFNMSAAGTYTFNASSTLVGDANTANNAMPATNISFQAGTVIVAPSSVCAGSTTTLSLSGNTSTTIQWEESTDGGVTWTPIVGATTTPYVHTPTDTTWYHALVCGLIVSTVDTVLYVPTTAPVTVNDTVCGLDTVLLTASGAGTLNWYTTPSGGSPINTGTTYSPIISTTTTYYVESNAGGGIQSVGLATNAAGGGQQTSTNYNIFDVTTACTLVGAYVYPGAAGNVVCELRDNAGVLITTRTVAVTAADINQRTYVALNIPLTVGTGFRLQQGVGSVSMFRNSAGVAYPYTLPGVLSLTGSAAGGSFYYWFYDWQVLTGCASTRTAVIGVVNPPPAVTATSSNNVCGNGTSTLNAASVNSGYAYSWGPGATLNTTMGATVIASPTGPTSYTVTGSDSTTGCVDTAVVMVGWNASPAVIATTSDDTICSGTSVNLDVNPAAPLVYTIGTNMVQNTNTTYPAPYGNWYWGSRHQILITAADLTAAGMGPGFISDMSFFTTNLNGTPPLDAFEIKLGMSPQTSITAFYTGSMTSVFTSPSYSPVLGLNTHTFSVPFFWDGVSSIVVETCHNNSSFTNNVVFEQQTTSYNSCVYYRADAAGVCGNNAVTAFSAQRPVIRFSSSTTSWQYAWTPVASLNNPSIQNPVATPLLTTDYIVSATDTSTGCVGVDTVTVAVNMSPAPAFGPDTNICSNASLLLDGTAGTYAYLWQDMSTNQTYTVNALGSYNVLVTDTATGCTGTDSIMVGINAAPSFTLGSDMTVCAGTQVTFSGPAGQYMYDWSSGDTTMSIMTGTAGSYDLALTDSINGCSSMDTVMLSVNPVPVVALGADTSVCSASGSLALTGPAGAYSYMWSTMDTTMMISVNASGTYYVMVTDSVTSCMAGDSITVAYNTSPVASIGNDTALCSANGPLTLMGPAGPYMYMWSDMTSGMSTSTSGTGNYYLDVTDSLTGCTASDSIMVTVNMSPAVTLTDTTACGSQVTLMGPSGPYAYLWNTTATSQSIAASSSGNYAVTVTDTTSGCMGMDSAMVTLNSDPTVTASASSMSPCADDANVMLTGSPAGGTFTGTSVTGSQFDPSIGAGSYNIVYNFTDVNGCSGADTITVVVSACVGIAESFVGAGMNVYPNPNAGSFTFTAADQNCNELTIELTTVEGKVLQSNMFSNVQGNFVQEINMNEYANGIYIMRVTTDGAVYTQRVVKQE